MMKAIEISPSTRGYGLVGNPVAHSLSPFIYNFGFKYHGVDAIYLAFNVEPAFLIQAVQGLRALGIRGFNVTAPHKETMVPLVQDCSEVAQMIGAVNTVIEESGSFVGHNTDVVGFTSSISPWKAKFEGGAGLVVGAGGSARAVVHSLLSQFRLSEIVVASRRAESATALAMEVRAIWPMANISAAGLGELPSRAFGIVVNCTPVGLAFGPEMPVPAHFAFSEGSVAMDLTYNTMRTPFLVAASTAGAIAINGLDMLLYQAAASFEIWTGLKLPVDEIRNRLLPVTL